MSDTSGDSNTVQSKTEYFNFWISKDNEKRVVRLEHFISKENNFC